MIEIKNLSKRFDSHLAVDNISFTIEKGEIVGFLGPNGAGKSTTMNMITGYISSSMGEIKINGFDILENAKEAKKCIGYLPEQPPLYIDMKVTEFLSFVYDLKKVAESDKKEHIQKIINMTGLKEVQTRLIKNLSKGYKQRVGLAQALIGNPEVLILDEPTVGLDPNQIIEIRNVIKELGKEHTIILSSHILSEISAICSRVIIIDKGKIIAEDTPENLSKNGSGQNRILAKVQGDKEAVLNVIEKIEGIEDYKLSENQDGTIDITIEFDSGLDIKKELTHKLIDNNLGLLILKDCELTLEDIFRKLTSASNIKAKGDEDNVSDI